MSRNALTSTSPLSKSFVGQLSDALKSRRSAINPVVWAAVPSIAVYIVFIIRTAFVFQGQVYFSLFDDLMIGMRYGRNLADGHGLVWNPGETPVEGYTNLLWVLLMAVVHLLPIDESKVSLGVMLMGAATLIAVIVLTRRLTSLFTESHLIQWVATFATAICYPLIFWTLRGIEAAFLTMILLGGAILAIRLESDFSSRKLFLLAGLFASAILTRTDAVLPVALLAGYAVWRTPRRNKGATALVLFATIVGTIAGHTAFRIAYYGDPFPNTYYLKVAGIPLATRLARGVAALASTGLVNLYAPIILAGAYLLKSGRKLTPPALLMLGLFVCQCAYSLYVGGDAWEWMDHTNRYLAVTVPFLNVLAALGVRAVLDSDRAALFSSLCLVVIGAFNTVVWFDRATFNSPEVSLETLRYRAGAGVVIGTVLLAMGLRHTLFTKSLESKWAINGAAVAVAISLMFAANFEPFWKWAKTNAVHVKDDAQMTRLGLFLRENTSPSATIATVWAGAIPYFSERPSIDLLGKTDPVVAHLPPQTVQSFYPGHSRWDYTHSIGKLRPDIVAQLWAPTLGDLRYISSLGYELFETPHGKILVRRDSREVRRESLVRMQEPWLRK